MAGDNNALAGAIRIWKLALADVSRADNSADWAATQMNLGVALGMLGARESGTARLEEAVAAFVRRWRSGRASGCRSTGR